VRSVSFVGYDLSYRVRALEAASATTQRTENPIRTLFVFLDPRLLTGKESCFLELVAGGDSSAPLRAPPRPGTPELLPRRFGGSLAATIARGRQVPSLAAPSPLI